MTDAIPLIQSNPSDIDDHDDNITNNDILNNLQSTEKRSFCDKCCSCCKKKEEDNPPALATDTSSEKNETAQQKLVAEECLDATVNKIVDNLSWVNATLLATAASTTMYIHFNTDSEHETASNSWIYFFAMFFAGILLAILPRLCEDITEMRDELDLKSKEQEAEEKRLKELKKHKEIEWVQSNKSILEEYKTEIKQLNTGKIYKFMEAEVNDLWEKFEDLFVAILSNTVSMAWRDAAKSTFAIITDSASSIITASFFYAIFMTTFGIYIVIRIGKVYQIKEEKMITYLKELKEKQDLDVDNTNQDDYEKEERSKLLRFAFQKRTIKLTKTVIKFAISWSWRDCINLFIAAIYGTNAEDDNGLLHQWGYFFTILGFVSLLFSFSEQFYILYPKNSFSPEDQQSFLKDESRLQTNEIIGGSFSFVVGLALWDATLLTFKTMDDDGNLETSTLCIIYWTVAISGMTLSTVGTHYISRWKLKSKIDDLGPAQAIFDKFEYLYDPSCEIHEEGDHDFVPMILDTTFYELINVLVSAMGLAGSMGITNAVKYTINEMTSTAGGYDLANPDAAEVAAIWIALIVCLVVSTIITAYFARTIKAAKLARRRLFTDYNEEDEKRELEKQLSMYDDDEEDDDDDDDDEKHDSDDEKSQAMDDDENKKHGTHFSTKAGDEGAGGI